MKAIVLTLLLALHYPAHAGGDSGLPVVKLSPKQPASAPAPDLPRWKTLNFHEEAFWATASSRLELTNCEDNRVLWCLQATSSVVSNRENIRLSAHPGGRLLQRERASEGSSRRKKTWSFGMTSVTRERSEPDANGDWRKTSSRSLPYPGGDPMVTDALLLLVLAAPDRQQRKFVVNTDFNFYRVEARPGGTDSVEVEADLDGGSRLRQVDLVTLVVEPIPPLQDNPDFALLGLSGDIVLAYDRATGIPVQVRGQAPRIGAAELTLRNLELRKPAP